MFKLIVRNLTIQYILFWALPLLLAVAYETGFLTVGLYADSPSDIYVWETAGILTAICCIPLALKLFSFVLRKKIDGADLEKALSGYVFWNGVRLGILEIAVLLNAFVYYLTLSNVGAFCGLMALTASLFCLPGEKRVREELNLSEEE